jgi:hypothetical protein
LKTKDQRKKLERKLKFWNWWFTKLGWEITFSVDHEDNIEENIEHMQKAINEDGTFTYTFKLGKPK